MSGVSMYLNDDTTTLITLSPKEELLEAGMSYRFTINPDYKATDGSILEGPIQVNFTTTN